MNDVNELSREELRKMGFEEGKTLTIHFIQDCIAQERILIREQIDCECVDTRCSMHMEPDNPCQKLKEDSEMLSFVAASDSGIDAVLDAVFVGAQELKDLELAQMRLDGFEKFRKARAEALCNTVDLLLDGNLREKGWFTESEDVGYAVLVEEQLDSYVIPMLQKEIDALGD